MGKLGVSIYPDKMSLQETKDYLDLAHKYGFKRIFTSLLQIKGDQEAVVADFKAAIEYGNSLGMETMVDINPALFKQLGVSYDDLKFFNEIGAWGVRLDEGFTGMEEARMTHNPYGLKIEVNMSRGTHYIDQIMDYSPDRSNLIGSHNFYPQRFTGLGMKYFKETSGQYRHYNLNTAAFVNAPSGTFGPWPLQDGMVSLELHRGSSLATQITHYKLLGLIDDILIANAVPSEEDLKEAADAFNATMPELRIEPSKNATDLEKKIIFESLHTYRGDKSDFVLRSTMTRVWYKDSDVPANNVVPIKKGDVLLMNNKYGQYKAETQIALQDLDNNGRINVVGHIAEGEELILDNIAPWSDFKMVLK
ncbi:DUF871 domain-containing protein [Pediococcus claussenii]|uniref:Outer surface protein n=1 Tax=Pediococcus claussenii (strain ATCC BAA-344 / DSM 14800 / JCM 18046 / KCTC 3811 / LMG 21948 / P06) TaxID=701521 RepID=G8PBE2_PEDCP|nr:MupG family TIM beta-alpha barrel fold protein [Pediococcus claussenii]AEV95931.1 hypothetical protein PECL_1714 [Pediococcus claussenii ATCC BAA-344]ANZ69421.1 hypothetical protein AYR57_03460 [Pediococcus claussenii]ANZ71241.1 hypothetical protein AYR58_03475 [Pediococcus claussenii]KRN20536.1 hypothetical protein IV79_GL000593 [Pediococcus claussenii]